MTSYPARINGVASVWQSILNQSVPKAEYHCVLVLAEPEFPTKHLPQDLQNLIDGGDVELIWYPVNIKSHKKLMPTLKKYPHNPILVVDDDIIRGGGWLKVFIDDHKKYPEDIITGTFQFFLDDTLTFSRLSGFKQAAAGGKNHIPGLIMNFARPANGCAGTLYPADTFKDKRFFDEEKMMEMSPTSDESWQYVFNIMADKTMRQTSVIFDESAGVVPGSQKITTALYRVNKSKYQSIFNNFFKEYPEFKKKMVERQNRCIVSLTSYPARFGKLPEVIESLVNQTVKPNKIVLVLTEEDRKKLTPELCKMENDGKFEVIVAEEDLKPHKKYFYTMKKYPQYAIITVDDDIIFAKTMVETLLKGYQKHPDCVIARRVHKIVRNQFGFPRPYSEWVYECRTEKQPSMDLFATGGAGALYPPNILDVSEISPEEIKNILNADDVFLKSIEKRRNIKVLYVEDSADYYVKDSETQKNALYKTNCHGGNDEYILKLVSKDVAKAIKPAIDRIMGKKTPFNPKVIHTKKIVHTRTSGKPGSKYWDKFFNE